METTTPMNRVKAKPVTRSSAVRLPSHSSTRHVMMVEKLPSLMAGHARLNPTSMEEDRVRPMRISSFIRSKMRMLASTARPMDKMKAPMPESPRVTGTSLNTASTTRV